MKVINSKGDKNKLKKDLKTFEQLIKDAQFDKDFHIVNKSGEIFVLSKPKFVGKFPVSTGFTFIANGEIIGRCDSIKLTSSTGEYPETYVMTSTKGEK